jgi:threonine dehydrogenase-like Zn-dependent dehydrogenase
MSRHPARQRLADAFGATQIVAERGEVGSQQVRESMDDVGADAVLECVGTEAARLQALACVRPGGTIGTVGLPHGELPSHELFWRNVGLRGGPAPVRAYLEDLLGRVLAEQIDPGRVFDLEMPLADVADAYRAMDQRAAIKVLLRP